MPLKGHVRSFGKLPPTEKQLTVPAIQNFGAGDLDALQAGKDALRPSKIFTRSTMVPKRSSLSGSSDSGHDTTPSGDDRSRKANTSDRNKRLKPLSTTGPSFPDFGVNGNDIPDPSRNLTNLGKVNRNRPPPNIHSGRDMKQVFLQGSNDARFPVTELPVSPSHHMTPPVSAETQGAAKARGRLTTPQRKLPSVPKAPRDRKVKPMKQEESKLPSQKAVLPTLNPYEKALEGFLEGLPPQRSSVVRIFLSSTFSDFKAERNALAFQCYPELREYCAELGLDFQVVDLRWGISEESSNDHTVEDICLLEIDRCQRLSRGPNFVAIVGNRYGYRPLPPKIECQDFLTIRQLADELQLAGKELLDKWYQRDNNSIPNAYNLQPVNKLLPFYTDDDCDKKKEHVSKWNEDRDTMQVVLRKCASEASSRGQIDSDKCHMYNWSVTEQEITNGILKVHDANKTTFYFRRCFNEANNLSECKLGGKFFDLTKEQGTGLIQRDSETVELIGNLDKTKIKKSLGLANIHKFSTPWTGVGIDPSDPESEHATYINKFCAAFTETAKRLVEEFKEKEEEDMKKEITTVLGIAKLSMETAKQSKSSSKRPKSPESKLKADFMLGQMAIQTVIQEHARIEAMSSMGEKEERFFLSVSSEILHHLYFCKAKCKIFCGRDEELKAIKNLLNKPTNTPLVVHGGSGHGKTAFIAAIAEKTKTWFKQCVTIIRFLGTSPKSTDISKVLVSVCSQICVVYGQMVDKSKFSKMKKLTTYFMDLLSFVSIKYGKSKPLVILLDSIDQLSPANDAYKCAWLPKNLPDNIYLVVSTLSDRHDCLQNLTSILGDDLDRIFQLSIFTSDKVVNYVHEYTKANNVSLTETQCKHLVDKLRVNPEPLYMKVLLDEACKWCSYTDVTNIRLADTTKQAIHCLFEQLERKYSPLFIKAAISYLTLGLNGLSEIELEDALSCNDEVLQEVYKYHNPPVDGVVRIPSLLWSRVRHDLNEYIVERRTHNKITMFWYHRQFIEVATEIYAGENVFIRRHRQLADIYLTTDTFHRTIFLPQRKLTIDNADRLVTPQPQSEQNVRRLTSLPYHLRLSGDSELLKEAAYCNMDFILKYTEAFSVTDLIQEMAATADTEVDMVRSCLQYTVSLGEASTPPILATQILGQLNDKPSNHMAVKKLCKDAQSTLEKKSKGALVPITGGMAPSTSLLKWYMGGITDMMCKTDGGDFILLKSESGSGKQSSSFSIINAETLTTKPIYSKTRLVPKQCVFSKNAQRLYILCMKFFHIVDVLTGNILFSQNTDTNHKDELNACIAVSSTESYLSLAGKDRLALLESKMEMDEPFRTRSVMNLSGVIGTSNMVFATDDEHTISTHTIQGQKKTFGCMVLWDFWMKALKIKVALPATVEPGFLYQMPPSCGQDFVVCGCENAQVLIINIHAGEIIMDIFKELSIKAPILSCFQKHSSCLVTCIKGQQEVKVWNVGVDGVKDLATFNTRSPVTTVSMSSDANTILTADEAGMLKLFDVPSVSTKKEIQSHNGTLSKIICTEKDLIFTCAADKMLKNWSIEELLSDTVVDSKTSSAELTSNLKIDGLDIWQCVLSSDKKHIATSSPDGILLWSCAGHDITFKKIIDKEKYSHISFSPNGNDVFALSTETQMFSCWDIASGNKVHITNIVPEDRFESAITDGQNVSVLLTKGSSKCYVVDMAEREATINPLRVDKQLKPCCVYDDAKGTTYVIGHTESQITAFGVQVHNVVSVNLSTGEWKVCRHEDKLIGKGALKDLEAFSLLAGMPGEGVLVASYGGVLVWHPDQDKPHDMKSASGGCWPEKALHHYLKHQFGISVDDVLTVPITMICRSRDRSVTMTGCRPGYLLGWRKPKDPNDLYASVMCLKGHTSTVTSAEFNMKGDLMITGSHDRTIRLWNVDEGKQLSVVHMHLQVGNVLFSPSNNLIAAISNDMEKRRLTFFKVHIQ